MIDFGHFRITIFHPPGSHIQINTVGAYLLEECIELLAQGIVFRIKPGTYGDRKHIFSQYSQIGICFEHLGHG